MIGSIIGDIAGSIYEFHNIKTKDFPLFTERTQWTDDTILTISTAKWILEGGSASDSGRYYFRYGFNYPHPMGGYGDGFQRWLWAAEKMTLSHIRAVVMEVQCVSVLLVGHSILKMRY